MNVFAFLKSLDDILYEVVSWLAFYPLTLWRVIRQPLAMMKRGHEEVRKEGETRFDDALSPPLLLLLTIIVSHGIEIAMIGQSILVEKQTGLAGYIKDDTSLILLRMVAFSLFPLVFAVRAVRAKREPLTRATLEPEFYAQSFVNAPYALAISIAGTLAQIGGEQMHIAAAIISVTAVLAFLTIETLWFRSEHGVTTWRAIGHVLRAYCEALVALAAASLLVGGDLGL